MIGMEMEMEMNAAEYYYSKPGNQRFWTPGEPLTRDVDARAVHAHELEESERIRRLAELSWPMLLLVFTLALGRALVRSLVWSLTMVALVAWMMVGWWVS